MKKIRYFLIIFPVLLFLISNVNATTIYEDNQVLIDENFIYDGFDTSDDYSKSSYPYLYCVSNSSNLNCYAFSETGKSDFSVVMQSNDYTYLVRTSSDYFEVTYNYYSHSLSSVSHNNSGMLNLRSPSSPGYVFVGSNFDFPSFYPDNATLNILSFGDSPQSEEPEEPEEPEYIIKNRIYLPLEITSEQCPIILNKDTIRVYDEIPSLNSTINYTDYYINSHYISKNGTEEITQIPNCIDIENFTTTFYYRFDFHEILTIFIILVGIVYFIFSKLLHAFFIGFKH